jgi:hypothetical protein
MGKIESSDRQCQHIGHKARAYSQESEEAMGERSERYSEMSLGSTERRQCTSSKYLMVTFISQRSRLYVSSIDAAQSNIFWQLKRSNTYKYR